MVKKFNLKKSVLIIMLSYLILCIGSCCYMLAIQKVRNGLMALLFTVFPLVLIIASKLFRFKLTPILTTLILLLAFGGLSGTIYEMYLIVPVFDDILHAMSGFIFATVGFMLMKHFVGEEKTKKNFIGSILLAFSFSLAIAVIWELFEYATIFLGFDMQEDTLIREFNSYLLAGSHSEAFSVDVIIKTVIYYGDGLTVTIDGYLDIGLIDTITDMLMCTLGAIVFTAFSAVSYFRYPRIIDLLVPDITLNEKSKEEKELVHTSL